MPYRFHEFDNRLPLSTENIIDEIYQLFVLAPFLWTAKPKYLVRRSTLFYAGRSKVG